MPILVIPTATPTQVAQPTVIPPPVYSVSRWSWQSPTGRVRSLMDDHPYLRPGGVDGHMAAPIVIADSRPPSIPGGVWRSQVVDPREVTLILLGHSRDADAWSQMCRQVVADFDTSTSEGVLTVAHPDGNTRALRCRYVDGLGAPVEGEPGVVKYGTFAVQLRAYDPWWYGPVQRRTFQPAVSGGFPWPPIVVQSTELIGSGSVVTNPGDVEAYPVWTLAGPLSEVTATAESGASWTVTKTLGPGEVVTVDTDPRAPAFQRVTDFSGSNLWGIATPDYPDLWPLPAGDSTVTVAVSGASSATRIHMDFNPRYRTA